MARGSTAGLQPTRQECLANASKGGQRVIVAVASYAAVLATRLLRERGRGRGPLGDGALPEAGALAIVDRFGRRGLRDEGFSVFLGLALLSVIAGATITVGDGSLPQVSVTPRTASSALTVIAALETTRLSWSMKVALIVGTDGPSEPINTRICKGKHI